MAKEYGPNDDLTPISMWGYFGYELLFAIPCIGFIILVVLALASSNVNVRNFARSYFCFLILLLILVAALVFYSGTFAALGSLGR